MENVPQAVKLTPKGLALCDFAFRDGPSLGLSDHDSMEIAKRFIEQWDGTETLKQIYERTQLWPNEIEDHK